jgi:hypothetical protein
MTRRSKRELEQIVDDLAGDGDDVGGDGWNVSEVWGDDDPDPDADLVVRNGLVMLREDAEREGREILGPAEDAPTDAVRVAVDGPGATRDGSGGG